VFHPTRTSPDGSKLKFIGIEKFLDPTCRDRIWSRGEEFDGVKAKFMGSAAGMFKIMPEDEWTAAGFFDQRNSNSRFHARAFGEK
jgi:hypothetical protein